ncbi:MAG: hypothetical protein ACI8X5_003006 [Planctomycetota bacterium]|jgi:hypothetical protein
MAMASKRKQPPAPLFDQIVFAPDREAVPGARRVISWDEEDEAPYLKAIEEVATMRATLTRRDHHHGSWAELDLSSFGVDPLRMGAESTLLKERWQAARPILLPGLFADFPEEEAQVGLAMAESLLEPGGLSNWLKQRKGPPPSDFAPATPEPTSDERALEKISFERKNGPALWTMSSRLSRVDNDASLRCRVSFGREVDDDASFDRDSHLDVTRLAEFALPGALRIDLDPGLGEILKTLVTDETYLTQHIAYWNAPNGGALMHHDAFAEENNGGQLGVVYTQLSGTTAWLCLSIEDLADRIEDYLEFLGEGGADWVRKALWPERRDLERLQARAHNRAAFLAELATPGCGRFGPLVNYGPDFSSFLADAGHAFFVRAGDSLLMPSHGLANCAMHSVFCASDERTYAISAALRSRSDPNSADNQ